MQMLRDVLPGSRGRLVRAPLVVVGVALALTVSACGDDDDDGLCSYVFADVPDTETCAALADEFDCSGYGYNPAATECTIQPCGICQDVDTDFDGDFDFDGDIDVDD